MTSDSNTIDAQRCPGCGGANDCAIAQGSDQNQSNQQCWCMVEPIGAPLPTSATASCYCRRCLQNLSASKKPAEIKSPQLHKPNIPR